ncbi:MAG: superoxide dismutase [Rikenellaceae bacterium]
MEYKLFDLPYAMDALEPEMSKKTLEYHYGKHHRTYVEKYNALLADSTFKSHSIEQVIKESDGALFNNAAQAWNHTFFFEQLSADPKIEPTGALLEAIELSFGSFGSMKEQMAQAALTLFGSGWVWLVRDGKNELMIAPMGNANTPLKEGREPILTIDVWEHAYYIDYFNSRVEYLTALWKLIDWKVIEKRWDR